MLVVDDGRLAWFLCLGVLDSPFTWEGGRTLARAVAISDAVSLRVVCAGVADGDADEVHASPISS